ncbi:MAG TPA: hypothetical protein VMS99_12340 [Acidimicrobiia bacterium]|nr:hypothetical protein [Acidimicrobiia bacterium]
MPRLKTSDESGGRAQADWRNRSSPSKSSDLLRSIGADHVIDYT